MNTLSFDYSNGSKNPYTVEPRHNLIPICFVCRKYSNIILDGSDYFRYFVRGDGYIQDVFPYLTASQREHILTGIHPDCQKKIYGGMEEM